MNSHLLDISKVFFRCVEDSRDTIMITDDVGKLIYVNPAWEKIYGYSRKEALGQTPRILRSEFQSEDFYKSMWSQILNPEIGHWSGELVNKSKDGQDLPMFLTITTYKEGEKIKGYMGIALDMREKKALEAKIMQQDRLASIGLLSSGVAHEVGTPLGIIRGRAELLKYQNKSNSDLASNLDLIIAQIDRVSKIITSLLNLTRKQNTVGIAIFHKAVEEIAQLVSVKLNKNKIELKISPTHELRLRIAHNQLEQVILNLLINSIHAIESAIKGGRLLNHQISIYVEEKQKEAQIIISDTGCGIEKQNIPHIFKPFFTTKDVGEGTGLGLSISSQIIADAGGNIRVESDIGVGTRFYIKLPKA